MKLVLSLVATLLCVAGGARADEPFRVGLPVDCAFGSVCSVQNYVDLDPGPGRLDPGCGRLSYDGHDGTDSECLISWRCGRASEWSPRRQAW